MILRNQEAAETDNKVKDASFYLDKLIEDLEAKGLKTNWLNKMVDELRKIRDKSPKITIGDFTVIENKKLNDIVCGCLSKYDRFSLSTDSWSELSVMRNFRLENERRWGFYGGRENYDRFKLVKRIEENKVLLEQGTLGMRGRLTLESDLNKLSRIIGSQDNSLISDSVFLLKESVALLEQKLKEDVEYRKSLDRTADEKMDQDKIPVLEVGKLLINYAKLKLLKKARCTSLMKASSLENLLIQWSNKYYLAGEHEKEKKKNFAGSFLTLFNRSKDKENRRKLKEKFEEISNKITEIKNGDNSNSGKEKSIRDFLSGYIQENNNNISLVKMLQKMLDSPLLITNNPQQQAKAHKNN